MTTTAKGKSIVGIRSGRWRSSLDREGFGFGAWIVGTLLAAMIFLVLGAVYYWIG